MTYYLEASFNKRFRGGPTIQCDWKTVLGEPSLNVICGPSGSGKTTFLRCLAGLEPPTSGSIKFGTKTWYDAQTNINLTPQHRDIGFCFQDYALFPHLTVQQNLTFGLIQRSSDKSPINQLLEKFDLERLIHRYPHELSGGEQQRVALARSLVRKPDLLMIDEPFAALDQHLKIKLRRELKALLKEFNIPVLLVTHDRNDILALADQVLVFHHGSIIMQGGLEDVFSRPNSPDVAQIVGVETIITGFVTRCENGMTFVRVGEVELQAVTPAKVSARVHLCLRGEDVIIMSKQEEAVSSRNQLLCLVTSITPEGALFRIGLDCGFDLFALITKQSVEALNLQVADKVTALIKAPAIHLIPY